MVTSIYWSNSESIAKTIHTYVTSEILGTIGVNIEKVLQTSFL